MQNIYCKAFLEGQKNSVGKRLFMLVFALGVFVFPSSSTKADIAQILKSTRISLHVKDQPIVDIIAAIEDKTGLFVAYNSQKFDVTKRVTLKVKNETLDKVFHKIMAGYEGTITELDSRHIVISVERLADRGSASLINNASQQEVVKIAGTVHDENGETLPGVSVQVKGGNGGAITDTDGRFAIEAEVGSILIFSFIGFGQQEYTVGQAADVQITLQSDSKFLEEVVVVGYGTVKRAELGGAVATADAKAFEARPVMNAANALQGVVPGLTVIRNGGAPGNNPTLRIRDISSINGGTPLVLIDGAEGNLNLINPNDIETISVLKDGSAAIYGARAADGVILVTTKNGKRNQSLKIDLNSYYAVKTPALLKKPATLYEHAAMGLEITDGSFPTEYTQEELALIQQGSDLVLPAARWGRWSNYPKFYKNQDWNDLIIGNGSLQSHTLGLAGGGEKYSYRVSLGTTLEEGLPKFGLDNNKRYFARIKTNIELARNVQYEINFAYEANNRNYSSVLGYGQSMWELIYKTRTWAPLYNPAGRFYTFEGFDNPAQVLEEGGDTKQLTGNLTLNNQLSWQIMPGLNLVGRAVVRKTDGDSYIVQKRNYNYNWENVNHRISRSPNSAERNYDKTLYRNFTMYAEYKKTFGQHDIGVMAGTAHEGADYDRFWAKRINFDQEAAMPVNLGSPLNQEASSQGNAWTINSFFSRVNYAYAGKYLFEATLRADGSSRFAPDSRWGYFPGANVAWRAGEESFIKNLNVFDDLKLRASYGEMGNQSGIGYYDYVELITLAPTYYPFGSNQLGQLARQSNLVSTDRTWETVISKNVGLDFSVLRDRLYGSLDYFWKVNENMLIPVSYPSTLGVQAPPTNSGRLEIKGWEVNLGWRDRIGELNYTVAVNVADAQNKVVSRVGNSLLQLGNNVSPQGYSTNSYFGYAFDGIIQNEEALAAYEQRFPNEGMVQSLRVGDAKYRDLDGDGRLTALGNGEPGSGDMVYLGNTNPRYNFGINLSASYKGFDLSALLQGVGERSFFFEAEARMPFAQPWFQSASYWYGKTWTPERTDARFPAITSSDRRNYNYQYSTNVKFSSAYMRMKNLQVGYTIPNKITQKVKIEKIRVYFSGEDLFEIHNTPGGWDPEEGGNFTYYPFTRSYSLGASFVF
jgi:TonB-linked SusC/RagA family outer membrane protein